MLNGRDGGGSGISGIVRMVVVMVVFIRGNGDIVMLVLMTTAIRAAVEICTYLFIFMFCGGVCSVGSHVVLCCSVGSHVVVLVVVTLVELAGMVMVEMVRYWWSSDCDVGDVNCCYGGSCY